MLRNREPTLAGLRLPSPTELRLQRVGATNVWNELLRPSAEGKHNKYERSRSSRAAKQERRARRGSCDGADSRCDARARGEEQERHLVAWKQQPHGIHRLDSCCCHDEAGERSGSLVDAVLHIAHLKHTQRQRSNATSESEISQCTLRFSRCS